ncbi:DNA repair protein RecO [Actibacterium atlanticum]|uniref:DNA repair protein RecO n=1 Tax=Actibacterium atlanticum TaxID=1461693 RepID=A0A058ZLU3_9RHOB|nr:DNA repair protein RecO [Actibacterium atlanticum]KCV82175.1 DNA repair protein RecO [Actibacterium atlanticum]
MEWRDQGAVLAVRRHGENAAIVELFTAEHGRHAGVVRGGAGRKLAPILQPGAQLDVTWRARLEDHLGAFTVEPVASRAAQVMDDRTALAGLNAITALLRFALPERENHPLLYSHTMTLLDMLGVADLWPLAYLRWEMSLLEELGFGLDLTRCAVTGDVEDLAYVSPRTGRAVSAEGAGEWADKLFPLPAEMLGAGDGSRENVLAGLRITGHFLTTGLAHALGDRPLPEPRARLIDRLEKDR